MENDSNDKTRQEPDDQFILRLPQEQAEQVRHALKRLKSKKFKKFLSIELDQSRKEIRKGTVRIKKQILHGKLVDLPCITESYKTSDKVQLFKTADIGKMLVCQQEEFDSDEENEDPDKTVSKKYTHPHGITAPMKNVRKQRFRKVLKNKEDLEEVAEIEKEVLWLLRADNEAVSSRFEIHFEQVQQPMINERELFGDISDSGSSNQESPTSSSQTSMTELYKV